MAEEKEKKLDIFLERKGLSRFKYFLSWFIIFSFISIINVGFISCLFQRIIDFNRYIFLNLVLFLLSLFCICLFFTTIFSSIQSSSSIAKLYNFGSSFLGLAIALPGIPKSMKIIFSLIPQINNYLCMFYCSKIIIFNFSGSDNLSLEQLKFKVNKISYIETIIMYLVDICFYFFISVFIQFYQRSGFEFIFL